MADLPLVRDILGRPPEGAMSVLGRPGARLKLLAALLLACSAAQAAPFLAGGDVSVLPLMAAHGARYLDRQGKPGSGSGADDYDWPAGSMDLPDLLRMARRAKALEMQNLPVAWAKELGRLPNEAARRARLAELVFERTRDVMLALQTQGTSPEFVSLGNEIEHGLLKAQPRVLGLLYWDPVMIATPAIGWTLREGDAKPGPNVVSNTTLFDFKGRALPVLDAWAEQTQARELSISKL